MMNKFEIEKGLFYSVNEFLLEKGFTLIKNDFSKAVWSNDYYEFVIQIDNDTGIPLCALHSIEVRVVMVFFFQMYRRVEQNISILKILMDNIG